jgi:hypothetical protein
MAEEPLLFGPIIEAAQAEAEREAKFQALCDETAAESERHDARPRLFSKEQMLRLEREYDSANGPSNPEELRAENELQNKIARATCRPEVRRLAREIAAAVMPQRF